ncbi:hypothetical protein [Nocardia otitidiscaviarum]|uniref:hypothetical protein n=1 Tax=Nocardia otitidiscaviarum TaxID=1823 RepID=UPI001895FE1C|nr:hypothetical protein [Nocardia otitidiscaviarum]MBF6180777.1 hypothetical protein [Nocardia otitidiscaviarum]
MDESSQRDPADERAVFAKLLSANAELVAEVLHPADGKPAASVIAALQAARSLDSVVDSVLRMLVQQARVEGHTWAEIGELFGTSRQAAFQRFGGPDAAFPPVPPPPPMPPIPAMPPVPNMPMPPKMPPVPHFSSMPAPHPEHHDHTRRTPPA